MNGSQLITDELLSILERYGSHLMAKHAIEQAMKKLRLPLHSLTGQQLELLVEEVMVGFRVFCTGKQRQQLWGELVVFIERHTLR